MADTVPFGAQIADYSAGRCADGSWDLCVPTFGASNVPAGVSPVSGVKINEWLADAILLASQDFVELINTGTKPVNIGGCFLSDVPPDYPTKSPIRQLTIIAPGGYLYFKADGDPNQGPDHLNFKLSPLQGEIGLFSPALALLDSIVYGPQSSDVSQGRTPNGGTSLAFFSQPTPGSANPSASVSGTTTVNVIPATQSWRYFSSAAAAPANDGSGRLWSDTAYTDTAWTQRAQLIYVEPAALTNAEGFTKDAAFPAANVFTDGTNTTLLAFNSTHPYQTYYFRTHFTYSGLLAGATVSAKIMCDDGAIIYLNGVEIQRVRVPAGANTFLLHADTNVGDAGVDTIVLPSAALVAGDNVIAVSVHQQSAVDQAAAAGSSDMVWGMKLDISYPASGPDSVVINEVLALNTAQQNPDGSFAGWVELYNSGAASANIADLSLTNDVSDARRFVFPAGTTIAAGGYLVVYCNGLAAPTASAPFNSGYPLNGAGGGVFLFKALASGGGLQDSVNYGGQLNDFSVGRSPNGSGAFALNTTTRGLLNSAAGTTQVTAVKINEWLSGGAPGWLELFNTSATPATLGGNFLTDQLTNKTKSPIPPLSFLAGTGASRWRQLIADNDNLATPGHVNFTIETGEGLGLYTAAGTAVDTVVTAAQPAGATQGRFPDGSVTVLALAPTPSAANLRFDTDGDGIPDAWETANGLNPNSAADAALDADGDGQSNLAEYLAGTNPQSAASRLAASLVTTVTPGVFAVRFTAVAGKSYTVRYKNALTDATWTNLAQVPAQGADTLTEVNDPGAGAQPRRFYQVVTPQQP